MKHDFQSQMAGERLPSAHFMQMLLDLSWGTGMCPSQIPHQQNIHGHKAAPVWGSCRENLLGSAKTAWETSVREG